jgi:hypothetical protein
MAFTFCSSLAAVTLALALIPPLSPNEVEAREYADGAFRDGQFQASISFKSGQGPHLAAARWNSERDRFAFVSGYQQQWRRLFEQSHGKVPAADEAQLTGYWDGLVEGAGDGRSAAAFAAGGGTRAEEAARIHSASFSEGDRQHYLAGFNAGYRVGYFAQHEDENTTLTSQRY